MSGNLSPEMQATQDQFIEALSHGPDAAEKMVNALAVETLALEVYADEWQRYEIEKVDIAEVAGPNVKMLDLLWSDSIIDFAADIKQQHDSAAGRYSFALWMLMNSKTQPE